MPDVPLAFTLLFSIPTRLAVVANILYILFDSSGWSSGNDWKPVEAFIYRYHEESVCRLT
jgi:hypothetical protein